MLLEAAPTWGATSTRTLPSTRQGVPVPSRPPASRRAPLVLAATGLALCLAATGLAVSMTAHKPAGRVAAGPASAAPGAPASPATGAEPGPGRIVLNGPGDVAVVTVVYEAGRSSGWHAHAGLHAIAVLSGELTIYDAACTPLRVVPGQPYVGGQELHLARNETDRPVEMIVTYLNPATASGDPGPRAAPAGCAVA